MTSKDFSWNITAGFITMPHLSPSRDKPAMEICIDMTAFFWEMLSSGFLRLMRSWVIDEARVILSFVSPCLNCKQAELSVRLHRAKDWKASLSVRTLSLFFFRQKYVPKSVRAQREACVCVKEMEREIEESELTRGFIAALSQCIDNGKTNEIVQVGSKYFPRGLWNMPLHKKQQTTEARFRALTRF